MVKVDIFPISVMLNVSNICHKILELYSSVYDRGIVLSPEQFYSIFFDLPPTQTVLLAVKQNTSDIVGLCCLTIESSVLYCGNKRCLLTELIVSPAYRHMGIGSELLVSAQSFAKKKSCIVLRAIVGRRLTPEEETITTTFFTVWRFRQINGHHVFEQKL